MQGAVGVARGCGSEPRPVRAEPGRCGAPSHACAGRVRRCPPGARPREALLPRLRSAAFPLTLNSAAVAPGGCERRGPARAAAVLLPVPGPSGGPSSRVPALPPPGPGPPPGALRPRGRSGAPPGRASPSRAPSPAPAREPIAARPSPSISRC